MQPPLDAPVEPSANSQFPYPVSVEKPEASAAGELPPSAEAAPEIPVTAPEASAADANVASIMHTMSWVRAFCLAELSSPPIAALGHDASMTPCQGVNQPESLLL